MSIRIIIISQAYKGKYAPQIERSSSSPRLNMESIGPGGCTDLYIALAHEDNYKTSAFPHPQYASDQYS